MKVAIPVWGKRVSPVFDTAGSVLVVAYQDRQETLRYRVELPDGSWPERVEKLRASGVDVLLCGAISRPLLDRLITTGIEVWPFRTGEVEALLQALIENRVSAPQFLMPGCCGRQRRRGNGRRIRFRRRKEEP